jgi:hypothetical protein
VEELIELVKMVLPPRPIEPESEGGKPEEGIDEQVVQTAS